MEGRIIRQISNDYTVLANNTNYICKPRGKFRRDGIHPLVGDFVTFDEKQCYLQTVHQRKNELTRPPISNVDQACVVVSVKIPALDLNLLDKMLDLIEFNRVTPFICFTKLDLLTEVEQKKVEIVMNYYQSIGYQVVKKQNFKQLESLFENKITVLTGQSGAGKSTLLNDLNVTLDLKTDDISVALGRGKHTTRHVELIPLFGGMIADTPGFSSLDFKGMSAGDIRDNMIEFNTYRSLCAYQDCMHHKEEDCEIKRKVEQHEILESRYINYLKFIESVKI